MKLELLELLAVRRENKTDDDDDVDVDVDALAVAVAPPVVHCFFFVFRRTISREFACLFQ